MKFKNTTEEPRILRGVTFPVGEAVEVTDATLAAKLNCLSGFVEAKRGPKPKTDD